MGDQATNAEAALFAELRSLSPKVTGGLVAYAAGDVPRCGCRSEI